MSKVESSRIEYKEKLNEKLEKEVVAFLNYQEGGIIYIGINSEGVPVGLEDVDQAQLKIVDRIKNNILPSTLGLFDVVIENIEGKDIIKIIISSGPEKPYYIKNQGMSPTGCYIRIGSSSQPMSTIQIDDLYSKRTRNSLGKIVSPRNELTFEQLKIFYEENGFVLNKGFTKSLELMMDAQYNYVAYLVSDENNISMKVAKYSGTDKIDLIENAEYGYCSIIKATKNILNKLDIENITKTKITGKEREERRLVNLIALREAVINAIVHNDYTNEIPPLFEIFSDKIVITSTGGLPQALTEEEFFNGYSAPRNKELMRIFKDVKLVEQLGSGMLRILKYYDKSIFQITNNFIRVTFKYEGIKDSDLNKDLKKDLKKDLNRDLKEQLNEYQIMIIAEMKKNPKITQKQLSELVGINERNIRNNIDKLKKIGIIKRIGSRYTGYWDVYV